MASPFTSDTLRFLRALKRNNDREWFKARRDDYDRHVRGPLLAIIERLAVDFPKFAPDVVASPKASLYRIYRDTRFSADKRPLKTHAAAVFPWKGMARHQGAGLYFEIAPEGVWIGGGMYAPETADLVRVRAQMDATWPEIRRIVSAPSFKRVVGSLEGQRLTRVPRGYAKDHPAAEYLKYRQFLAGREFPATFATSAQFYPTLTSTFKGILPLIRFLNESVAQGTRRPDL
jgi:uncharacterized protein (TIGR02453 family)